MNTFFAVGDLGDIIAFLPTIRQLGGGHLILGNLNGNGTRELMTQDRFDVIAPLIAAQPYITGVHHEDDAKNVTYDVSDFRKVPCGSRNLATWQAAHLGITDLDLSPWLTVQPASETRGKAIFARSMRYQNPTFNWSAIGTLYREAIFVGLPTEHFMFNALVKPIAYRPTSNLLEVAELIAGSEIFIGNQSAPFWIAAGLGHPLIQETWNVNSMVLRANAVYGAPLFLEG